MTRRILHAGCGHGRLPEWLDGEEIRLDIDGGSSPDIVASITEMGDIGPFRAVYCHHALEHLYPHEVVVALREFHRVLSPGGLALVFVPDLEDVRPTEEVLYVAACGSVAGLDLYYGFRPFLAESPYMAHHTGFVSSTLKAAFVEAGFAETIVKRLDGYNLMAAGRKA